MIIAIPNRYIRFLAVALLAGIISITYISSQGQKEKTGLSQTACHEFRIILNTLTPQSDTVLEVFTAAVDSFKKGSLKVADNIFHCMENQAPFLSPENRMLCHIYRKTASGIIEIDKGNYTSAAELIKEGLSEFEKLSPQPEKYIGKSHLALGVIYFYRLEYDLANFHFFKSLKYFEKNPQGNRTTLFNLYRNIGAVSLSLRRIENAKKYFTHASKYIDGDPIKESQLSEALGAVYFHTEDPLSSLKMYKRQLNALLQIYSVPNNSFLNNYRNIADSYTKLMKYDSALYYLNASIDIARQHKTTESNIDLGYSFYYLFNFYRDRKSYESAFKALDSVIYHLNYRGLFHYDSIQDIRLFKAALMVYSQNLKLKYERDKDISSLYKAKSLDSISVLFQQYILNNQSSMSNWQHANNRQEILSEAIKTNIILYDLTKDNKYLQDAFKISTGFKSALLAKSIRESAIELPDSSLKKIHDFNKELLASRLELKRLNSQNKDPDDPALLKANTAFFNIIGQKTNYADKIYKNSKAQITMQDEEISFDELARFTQENNSTLVDYWIGFNRDFGLVFTFSDGKLDYKNIPAPEKLDSLLNTGRAQMVSKSRDYINTGKALYQTLIVPVKKNLQNGTSLLIIPDENLGLFPFSALISNVARDSTPHYLMEEYSIGYLNSLQSLFLKKNNNSQWGKNIFLGLSPEFPLTVDLVSGLRNYDELFTPLKDNQEEVSTILSMTRGKILTNKEATKERLLKTMDRYKILHLATHARVDADNGLFSYLVLKGDSINNGVQANEFVYFEDITNNKLKTEMVVLSACETGFGNKRYIEGVLSLSRAFLIAGAKSTVSTLWQIEDQSSMKIMVDFYKNLSKNQTKDEALRNAQLNYLKQNHGAPPYYWAAFIPTGDMSPVDLSRGFQWWKIILAGGLCLGILLWLYRIRLSKLRNYSNSLTKTL